MLVGGSPRFATCSLQRRYLAAKQKFENAWQSRFEVFTEVAPDTMFVGHAAVALAAKSRVPNASLGTYVAAAFALDLLWPFFLLFGVELVAVDPGNTKFTP